MTSNDAYKDIKDWPERFGQSSGTTTIVRVESGHNAATFARGAFGEISLALLRCWCEDDDDSSTNRQKSNSSSSIRLVAVKTIVQATTIVVTTQGGKEQQRLCPDVAREIQAMQHMPEHRHVLKLLAIDYPETESWGGPELSLIMEYCPTDLYLTTEWRRRSLLPLLPMDVIQTVARDLFAALAHCHANNILHQDVKPGNLLVSSTGDIKLCDFGLATSFDEKNNNAEEETSSSSYYAPSSARGICTLHYRPPEVLLGGRPCHASVDVYSAGLVIAELVMGRILFAGINELDQIGLVMECLGSPHEQHWPDAKKLPHGQLEFAFQRPRNIHDFVPRASESPGLTQFLQQCLQLDPGQRRSSNELVCHDWLQPPQPAGRAPRRHLVNELIPTELEEPFVFLTQGGDTSVACKQAVSLAKARKSFLKNLEKWSKELKQSWD